MNSSIRHPYRNDRISTRRIKSWNQINYFSMEGVSRVLYSFVSANTFGLVMLLCCFEPTTLNDYSIFRHFKGFYPHISRILCFSLFAHISRDFFAILCLSNIANFIVILSAEKYCLVCDCHLVKNREHELFIWSNIMMLELKHLIEINFDCKPRGKLREF